MAPDGYAWWYVDALSDDGQQALTLIAFVGSVFSPYYAAARRRGPADPTDFCALNVALYRPEGKLWCMTERGRSAVTRGRDRLGIGPSVLEWHADALTAHIDEVTVPWPRRLRGTLRLHAPRLFAHVVPLDPHGVHRWAALAPCARIEVDFEQPRLRWRGHAYLDMNEGAVPLEATFASWHWSRATLRDGSTAVLYDVTRWRAAQEGFGLRFHPSGAIEAASAPAEAALPGTRWGIARRTRVDGDGGARVLRTLEDTPFYARSMVAARFGGEDVTAVHESLSLERFGRRIVQWMLPFRMPRRPA